MVPGEMLAAALQAEVAVYIEAFKDEVDEAGRRLVVRNGHHGEREVTTAAGAIVVRAPRVNDKRIDEATGERKRFASAILPAWARKSPRVAEVLPLPVPARGVQRRLHGRAGAVPRHQSRPVRGHDHAADQGLAGRGGRVQQALARRDQRRARETDDVYVWVDGIHLKVRLEQDKVCLLVMIGVRADGTKELIALDDGHRESTESWADLLRDCKRRGMAAPVLAVGDGALGLGAAVRTVFPKAREQR